MASLVFTVCKLCTRRNLYEVSKKIISTNLCINSQKSLRRFYSVYEPPYINIKPEIEEYQDVWIKLKGHEFSTLESYFKHVHKLLASMKVELKETWPMPTRHHDLITYKEGVDGIGTTDTLESVTDHKLKLAQYCRVIHMKNLPNTWVPILIEIVQQNLPEGIDMEFTEPIEEDVEFRYIPDRAIEALKQELEIIEEKKKKKQE